MRRRRGRRYKHEYATSLTGLNARVAEWWNSEHDVGEAIDVGYARLVTTSPAYLDDLGVPVVDVAGEPISVGLLM